MFKKSIARITTRISSNNNIKSNNINAQPVTLENKSSHAIKVTNSTRLSLQSKSFKPNHNNHSIHSTHSFDPNPTSDGARIGEVILTTKHGSDVLLDPLLNKGTGFPMEERERLGIRGLVPPRIPYTPKDSLQWQVKRIMNRYYELPSPIVKYSYLTSLQDRNEVLFYRCLVDYLEELAPIVYTPTVGAACVNFATLFRRPRGMYFSAYDKGMMHAMTFNWNTDDVEIIVVTDGSRILGLGDLGTNGMGIPIGKLALYTAAAGIHPSKCLPVVIDIGTNNEKLLTDTMYLGLQQKRLTGQAYLDIIDEFIRAVRERFPNVLIQFEDFSNENATRLLEKYRNKILCFNDDIQGTGTVALAGILGALRSIGFSKNPNKALTEQRIVICGAGSAGIGVGSAIKYAMMHEGLSEAEAKQRFWVLDDQGLLGRDRVPTNALIQSDWIRSDMPDKMKLEHVIETVKPTVLLGLTGVGQLFTERSIRTMAQYCPNPIIFPLSNPTDKAECTARQAYEWTQGKAIFASGSPFDAVDYKGKEYKPGQANNMYTFPGIGLGALTCRAKTITDNMLYAAARALADCVTDNDFKAGRIFPQIPAIPKVSRAIAFAISKQAEIDGVATLQFENDEALTSHIEDRFWSPEYGSMVRVDTI